MWQFNFAFDVDRDLHAKDSIELLRENGCDFGKHNSQGICPYRCAPGERSGENTRPRRVDMQISDRGDAISRTSPATTSPRT